MSYRDDLDAARARADALERELKEAKQALAEREAQSQALVPTGSAALVRAGTGSKAARRWLGAPSQLQYTRTIEGELPESAYTALVEQIRVVMGEVGVVSTLPGSLAWTNNQGRGNTRMVNIYITIRDDLTTIRAEEKLGQLAGAIFGGVGGGVGGGAIMLPLSAAFVNPALLPVTIPLWLGAVYVGCRAIFRGSAKRRANVLEQLVADLAQMTEDAIAAERANAKSAQESAQESANASAE